MAPKARRTRPWAFGFLYFQLTRIPNMVGARIDGIVSKLSLSLPPRELDRHSGIGQFRIEPSTFGSAMGIRV
jgi:hypothetical protein